MGCSNSKLDNEEAVQLCKDRKKFIKQAIEYRSQFAAGHIAYIQSLKRVFAAIRNYIEGDESHDGYFCDSYRTPIFTPTKKRSPEIVAIPIKLFSPSPLQLNNGSRRIVNYLRTGGNPSVSIEERPQSPETVRVEAYSPMYQYGGIDGFFTMDSSHSTNSFYPSPYNNRPAFPPPSPQNSQWDFFWNPFSSLDSYGYPYRDSFDRTTSSEHDEIRGLRQVREEEGIPDLEEEDDEEEEETSGNNIQNNRAERAKVDSGSATKNETDEATTSDDNNDHEAKGLESESTESVEVAETQKNAQLKVNKDETALGETDAGEETPGFTVYVNRRFTSMAEVMKDLETQFTEICNVASEISTLLEASTTQNSTSKELTAAKMLNPVALFRSASSRSTSSRLFTASSGYESSSDISEDSCMMFSGSHQSTLDRLYAWEKKLYDQVKSGERIRIAYEKKCLQLRNQDVKGEDPAVVDKTRAAIRDLHTQIQVSIHSVESISKRIETLRDEELHPQLIELIQGLGRMWRDMGERHSCQKRTVDEAKLLLASTPTKGSSKFSPFAASPGPRRPLAQSASALESELRNWRACFQSWIAAQRSYVRALTGWALRCARSQDAEKLSLSPHRSGPAPPPIFSLCVHWSRSLDRLDEASVTEGLDFFAAGIGSMYGQMKEEEAAASRSVRRMSGGGGGGEMVAVELAEEKAKEEEKTAEVAVKVLFGVMAVAVSSLTEFAVSSAEGYEEIVKQWEKDTWDKVKVEA